MYRTHALRDIDVRPGMSMRDLLAGLRVELRDSDPALFVDIDTPADLAHVRGRLTIMESEDKGSTMQEWVVAVKEALGLDTEVDIDLILDVAKDAAHGCSARLPQCPRICWVWRSPAEPIPRRLLPPFRSWPTVGPHRMREPDWPTARRLAAAGQPPNGPTGAAGRRRRPGTGAGGLALTDLPAFDTSSMDGWAVSGKARGRL